LDELDGTLVNEGVDDVVRLVVDLAVSEDLREQVSSYFRALVGPTSNSPGCQRCSVAQGLIEPKQFFFRAEWRTREDLDEYIKSNVFRSLLHILELAYRTPRVEFETVTDVQGMEYVAEVRPPVTWRSGTSETAERIAESMHLQSRRGQVQND